MTAWSPKASGVAPPEAVWGASRRPTAAKLPQADALVRQGPIVADAIRSIGAAEVASDRHFVDAMVVRANQHFGDALGRSQGGFSAELHLRADGGRPITVVLTARERHEQFALDAPMEGDGAAPGARPPAPAAPPDGRGPGLFQSAGASSPQPTPSL